MAYRNLSATHACVMPDWAEDSKWVFRRHLTDNDETAAARIAFEHKTKIDQKKLREATRRGEDYTPEYEQQVKANIQLALLEVMSEGWSGPEFEIPTEFEGEPVDDPHAGGTPPVTIHYMNVLLTPRQLEDVYAYMRKLWATRSPAQQADFRGSTEDVAAASSHDEREAAGEASPAGDH